LKIPVTWQNSMILLPFSVYTMRTWCVSTRSSGPEIISILRTVIDERARNSQFLILGSVGPDLIRQSSESLAGQIAYLDLTPFLIPELEAAQKDDIKWLWLRGESQRSFLAEDLDISFKWWQDFI